MKNPIEENREVNQGTEKYKLPRKKKITKSQEEMWNLIGNKKKNANQNNNGIQFLTM